MESALDDRLAALRAELFFFRADDGIRDWSVTGVQTCALPISLELTAEPVVEVVPDVAPGLALDVALDPMSDIALDLIPPVAFAPTPQIARAPAPQIADTPRSEERRVGKEWTSWVAPGQ